MAPRRPGSVLAWFSRDGLRAVHIEYVRWRFRNASVEEIKDYLRRRPL